MIRIQDFDRAQGSVVEGARRSLLAATLLACFWFLSPSLGEPVETPPFVSAWEVLLQVNPSLSRQASALEREALRRMTVAQGLQFQGGVSASEIDLPGGETLEEFLASRGAGSFNLSWFSLGGGGGSSSGGDFSMTGLLGSTEPEALTGGDFSLVGGFTGLVAEPVGLGTCDGTGGVFCDGFESGDTRAWSRAVKSAGQEIPKRGSE